MSKFVLLKSGFDFLVLKIPEKFCKDYQILRADDEITLNELIAQEQKGDHNLSLTRCYSEEEKWLIAPQVQLISLKQGDF